MTPHIGILFEFPTLNGGEHSMLAVLQQLASASDFRFSALAPPHGRLAEQLHGLAIPLLSFTVRDRDGKKKKPAELHAELQSLVAQSEIDLLHSNSLSMCRLTGQLDRLPSGAKRTGHLRDIVKLSKSAISDISHNNGLIAVSEATRRFHIQQGLAANRCHVVYNGIDTALFRRKPATCLRSKLFPDIPARAPLLLNVGQICLRKGQLDLAKSVCQLLHRKRDIHLVIAGERHSAKQESIEYEQSIQNEFKTLGKSAHLHMAGFRSDISDLMNAADLLVHTARQEPFGRTLLEAAACGLPIITTDTGGTAEMLRNRRDAILVPPGHPDELCRTITEVLEQPDRRKLLAQSARQRIVQKFSISTAANQTAAFWNNQLDDGSAAE